MKPLILITNDDGIYSPGLLAAAEAVSELGELLICAPIFQQTGMSRSFPRTEDLGIIEKISLTVNEKQVIGYGVHGSPAFAVAYGVCEIADRKPDLCISGINYGENLGLVLSCSGTVGAALEADSYDIPSIAVSKEVELSIQHNSNYSNENWDIEKEIIKKMVNMILLKGMPGKARILNINVPQGVMSANEYVWTRQSRQNYFSFIKPLHRNFDEPFCLKAKLTVDIDTLEKDSDIHAVYVDNKISITPLTWDMTEVSALEKHFSVDENS